MNGEAMANGDGTVFARGLRKCYGDRVVLDSIDLDVKCGEIVCIIGPSGSGKSTLLRCVDGLEEADRGVLRVNGQDLGSLRPTAPTRRWAARRRPRNGPGSGWCSNSSTCSRT
jgi:ABC-type Fe3+/spermidine/putrescine transport system ATPase subunit